MHALSASVVVEFCTLCDWAHEVWLNHRELFDNNPRASELMNSFAGEELGRLSIISQEYSLLQIVKLHDKAVMSGKATLGINYVLTYGGWSDSVGDRLEELARKLDGFASQLRDVRNKSLSHNDLATIVAGATLGEFSNGADEEYFKALQEFVNTVHDEVIGGPWPLNDLVKNDVAAFLAVLSQPVKYDASA
jgi:AbiU2